MIMQEFIHIDDDYYTCITKGINTLDQSEILVVFFHGFAQTMSGSYGLYGILAQQVLIEGNDFLCFDLPGLGDSAGNLEDYSFEDWIMLSKKLLDKFGTGYKSIVFVGNASGNIVALEMQKCMNVKDIILLEPYESSLSNWEWGNKILMILNNDENVVINTSDLGEWCLGNELDAFFTELGGGLNRARGLMVQKQLLNSLICYDYQNAIKNVKCNVHIFHCLEGSGLSRRDNLFMNMINREKVVEYISMILKEINENKGEASERRYNYTHI